VSGGRVLAARQWAGGSGAGWWPGSGPPTHAPRPRLAPQSARPAQLSAAFQAFVRHGSQPLHL